MNQYIQFLFSINYLLGKLDNLEEVESINYYYQDSNYSLSIIGVIIFGKIVALQISSGNLTTSSVLKDINIKPKRTISCLLRNYIGTTGFITIAPSGAIKVINNMSGNYVGNETFSLL